MEVTRRSARRVKAGHVYGRGTVDDKDNLTASLMTILLLKRLNVPLDRDVIFLSESGEEGSTGVGIGFMVSQHYPAIEAEYCLAEGGGVTRINGEVKLTRRSRRCEKIPRGIELISRGISGHGSVPLKSNAIVHMAGAVARIGEWRPEIRFNETTGTYFRRLAAISPPDVAKVYRDVLSTDPKVRAAADDWLFENEPRHSSMLRTSVSPNIFQGGYRSERDSVGSQGDARRPRAAGRGSGEVPGAGEAGGERSGRRGEVHRRQQPRPSAPDARLDSEPFKALEAAGRASTTRPRCRR